MTIGDKRERCRGRHKACIHSVVRQSRIKRVGGIGKPGHVLGFILKKSIIVSRDESPGSWFGSVAYTSAYTKLDFLSSFHTYTT